LPSNAILASGPQQVLLGQLVQSLDTPTRAHMTSFLRQLNTTLHGHEQDLNQTVATAGPAFEAFGGVLDGLGGDGQAIKTVLSNLHQVTDILAQRRASLSRTVTGFDQLTSAAARHEQQLSDGLAELPATLEQVRGTLEKIPAAADRTVPLLDDLRPATDRLPAVAADLKPVLTRLRPVAERLGPTLRASDRLFGPAPGFLKRATSVIPKVNTTLDRVTPALAYLRPYTPEAMGVASNLSDALAGYDSEQHFLNVIPAFGRESVESSPPVTTPGGRLEPAPAPGAQVDQPWTDANGSRPR
jgi:phospholipid/cholesterol/gamma-HCH transport system substrate-binding protein